MMSDHSIHIQALINDLSVRQAKNRHRCFGGGLDHRGGFVREHHLTQLAVLIADLSASRARIAYGQRRNE